MNLALKVRLYPTSEQQTLIDKTLGCCRKIYNLMLANRLEFYDRNIKGKDLTKQQKTEIYKTYKAPTEKEIKAEYEYMKEVSSVSLQQSRRDMQTAFERFFKGLGKFPKFHSKKQKNSYREVITNNNLKFDWNHRRISLPKLGYVSFKNRELPKWLKIDDKVCSITVNYTPLFRVVASFSCFTDNACKAKRLTLDNVEVFVSTEGCSNHSVLLVEPNNFTFLEA